MVHVWVSGEEKIYPEGSCLKDAAKDAQPHSQHEILLAVVDGKLQELYNQLKEGTKIEFLTAADKPGRQAYQRSAILLLLKAFYEVVGAEHIRKISVEYAISNGLFIESEGNFEKTQELTDRIKAKMQEYVAAALPISKRNVSTDEAMEHFHRHRMYEKERLFRYRRVSQVNLYNIGEFEDYYYGYMVQNTSCLKYFDLIRYRNGMMLLLPDQQHPEQVAEFHDREKLYEVLSETECWGRQLEVPTVGALNDVICHGKVSELILMQEALMEKKIGDIADQIAGCPEKKIVMIAGPSSSGKTSFSHRLSIQLKAKGLKPHPIAVDNYFVNRKDSPRDENGNYNYEVLECLDVALFNQNMTDLLAGKTVEMPEYNFIKGVREYHGEYLTLGADDVLVIEGIHCLNERLSYALPRKNKFKIYISALTQLNIDEHNRIPTTDGRLLRRIVRDARTRGASAQDTIRMWPSVRKGEEENIFPYQEDADIMFNSALVYELSVLKQYAEPVLFSVPRDSAEYMEAKRLLKFLDYFLGVSSEEIPRNSLIREFIGGSCFRV